MGIRFLGACAVIASSIVGCSSSDTPAANPGTGTPGRSTDAGTAIDAATAAPTQGIDAGASAAKTDNQYSAEVVTAMHDALLGDIDTLYAAAQELQAAAPAPTGRGWNATLDATALTATKTAWIKARKAYEHIEGALAPIFPDIDTSIDARYDNFMTNLISQNGDQDLFDDQGVTGMHAIERILYSNSTPQSVVDFEKALPGYVAARFPTTEAEATEFKTKLCQKFIDDAKTFQEQWTPAKIDVAIAFQGVISLMNEQQEKVNKASTFEEESRYSQRTMADLRDNLDGTKAIYGLFQPWLTSKPNATDPSQDGPTIDAKITGGFATVATAYAAVTGDAIPQPPASWSATQPSAADLASPFGQLYTKVHEAVDPNTDGSIVFEMNAAAGTLKLKQFTP